MNTVRLCKVGDASALSAMKSDILDWIVVQPYRKEGGRIYRDNGQSIMSALYDADAKDVWDVLWDETKENLIKDGASTADYDYVILACEHGNSKMLEDMFLAEFADGEIKYFEPHRMLATILRTQNVFRLKNYQEFLDSFKRMFDVQAKRLSCASTERTENQVHHLNASLRDAPFFVAALWSQACENNINIDDWVVEVSGSSCVDKEKRRNDWAVVIERLIHGVKAKGATVDVIHRGLELAKNSNVYQETLTALVADHDERLLSSLNEIDKSNQDVQKEERGLSAAEKFMFLVELNGIFEIKHLMQSPESQVKLARYWAAAVLDNAQQGGRPRKLVEKLNETLKDVMCWVPKEEIEIAWESLVKTLGMSGQNKMMKWRIEHMDNIKISAQSFQAPKVL